MTQRMLNENLERLLEEERNTALSNAALTAEQIQYLAICGVLFRALQELFEAVAQQIRDREAAGLGSVRQATLVRLTYLRAEADSCEALFSEVKNLKNAASANGDELGQAKVFALVKTASHLLSKILSTCSFILAEEGGLDPVLVNQALVFFAKLSASLGAAGNPSQPTKYLSDFVGLKTISA